MSGKKLLLVAALLFVMAGGCCVAFVVWGVQSHKETGIVASRSWECFVGVQRNGAIVRVPASRGEAATDPRWPDTALAEGESERIRVAHLEVKFTVPSKSLAATLKLGDAAKYEKLVLGSSWTVEINNLGIVENVYDKDGTVVAYYQVPEKVPAVAPPPPPPPAPVAPPVAPPAAPVSAPARPAYVEPLPAGAKARFGTTCFEQASVDGGLDFSPDGKVIAASSSRDVVFWDLDGRRLATVSNGRDVYGSRFSPDGKRHATTDKHGLTLRDVSDIAAIATISRFDDEECRIRRFAFTPDGKSIAMVGDTSQKIWILDGLTGQLVSTFVEKGEPRSLSISPDGKLVAVRVDTSLHVREIATGKVRFETRIDEWAGTIAFTPDGRHILVQTIHKLALHDATTGERRASEYGGGGEGFILLDARRVLAWDHEDLKVVTFPELGLVKKVVWKERIEALAYSAAAGKLAAGVYEGGAAAGGVRLADPATLEAAPLPGPGSTVSKIRFLGGDVLAMGGARAVAWTPEGAVRFAIDDIGSLLDVAPDGKRLAVFDKKNAVRICEGSRTVVDLGASAATTFCMARFSPADPDSLWMVGSGDGLFSKKDEDKKVARWSMKTREGVAYLLPETKKEGLRSFAVLPDGKRVLVGFEKSVWVVATDGTVRGPQPILENAQGGLAGTFLDELYPFPDGKRYLAHASRDSTAFVHDVDSGKEVAAFQAGGAIGAAAISPLGTRVAFVLRDGTVKIVDEAGRETVLTRVDRPGALAWSSDGRLAVGEATSVLIFEAGR